MEKMQITMKMMRNKDQIKVIRFTNVLILKVLILVVQRVDMQITIWIILS